MSQAPEFPAEKVITEEAIVDWLKKQIAHAKASADWRTPDGEGWRTQRERETALFEAILANYEMPKPKQSGVTWETDKRGAYTVVAHISAEDMKNMKLPVEDANLFHQLIEKQKAAPVLNAVALIFAAWDKHDKEERRKMQRIINEVAGQA